MNQWIPITLSQAWVESCERLWVMCEKHGRDPDNLTLWDGFKLLYYDSVPDGIEIGAGRKAKGVK